MTVPTSRRPALWGSMMPAPIRHFRFIPMWEAS